MGEEGAGVGGAVAGVGVGVGGCGWENGATGGGSGQGKQLQLSTWGGAVGAVDVSAGHSMQCGSRHRGRTSNARESRRRRSRWYRRLCPNAETDVHAEVPSLIDL